MISYSIKDKISNGLISLAWDVFFLSKNRGRSFNSHFPWVTDSSGFWSIEAIDNGNVIGGLIVKEQAVTRGCNIEIVGCVGLVCVNSSYRGKGIANKLFEEVISFSLKKGYEALTLWTSQHHIYRSQGFKVFDEDLYGTVRIPQDNWSYRTVQYESVDLPKEVGLAPFAISGNQYKSKEADITIMWDRDGGIVVDWNGDRTSVIDLIGSLFALSFRINSRSKCLLIKELQKRNCDVSLRKSNLQMWLPLNKTVNIYELESSGKFSVLNRI